jgi:predicted ATP-grasp superfamily ATP-dependent carboligase
MNMDKDKILKKIQEHEQEIKDLKETLCLLENKEKKENAFPLQIW